MTMPTLPILMYHALDTTQTRRFGRFTVSPERLEHHLRALSSAGLRGVSVTHLVNAARLGASNGLVGLSFDDAFTDFETAAHLLVARKFTATVYVPTAYVGGRAEWLHREGQRNRPLLSWSALGDLSAEGMEVGGHGHTHCHLDELPEEAAFQDLLTSRSAIQERLQIEPTSVCYPFGHVTRSTVTAARRAGWSNGCGVGRRLSTTSTDPMALDRLEVTDAVSGERLLAMVRGDVPSVGTSMPRAVRAAAGHVRRGRALVYRSLRDGRSNSGGAR